MEKPGFVNILRNALSGTLIGTFAGAMIAQTFAYGDWIRNAPTSPDTMAGLVYGHNEHGSLVFLSAAQSVGTNLGFVLIPIFFLGVFIGPKKNVRRHFLGARWDPDDPYHLQVIFVVIAATAALVTAKLAGIEVLALIAQLGIGVSSDTL